MTDVKMILRAIEDVLNDHLHSNEEKVEMINVFVKAHLKLLDED